MTIWYKYGKIRSISRYSVQMRENQTRKILNTDTFSFLLWKIISCKTLLFEKWNKHVTYTFRTNFSEKFLFKNVTGNLLVILL